MSDTEQKNNKIQISSLNNESYMRIRDEILMGHIDWGERINIVKLAEEFGISRSPVVKAVERLAVEGFVDIIPNKGSFVSYPTLEAIEEVTEIRLMIETACCRKAYKKNRDLFIKELEENEKCLKDINFDDYEKDFREFLIYDRSLHNIIVKHAGNNKLMDYFRTIRTQIEFFRVHTFCKSKVDLALKRHAETIAYLKEGDITKAVMNNEKHIKEVFQDTIDIYKKYISNVGEITN